MSIVDSKNRLSELMKAAQSGDQQAYGALLKEISPRVLSYVRRHIFNSDDIDDVYQEVLMTIHKARHTYDGDRPFEPWFYAVMKNTVYDFLRKFKRKRMPENLVGDFFETAPQELGETEFKNLKAALDELPEKQRQAVELLKIDGLTLEEAAKAAGVSVSAMKVRAHRGYESLRAKLSEFGRGE